MTKPPAPPFSLPLGIATLSMAHAGFGRVAALDEDGDPWFWSPGESWRRIEGAPAPVEELRVLRCGVALRTARTPAIGLFDPRAGTASWMPAPEPEFFDPPWFDGEFAIHNGRYGEGVAMRVLAAEDGAWKVRARVSHPNHEPVEFAWEAGPGLVALATGTAVYTVDTCDAEAGPRIWWTWKETLLFGTVWRRVGERTLLLEKGKPARVLPERGGEPQPLPVPFLPGAEPLLEAVLAGDQERLRRWLGLLANLPGDAAGFRPEVLALVEGENGPLAVLTKEGIVDAASLPSDLPENAWRHASTWLPEGRAFPFLLFLEPEAHFADAVEEVLDGAAPDLSSALRVAHGEALLPKVLEALRGREPDPCTWSRDAAEKLLSFAGKAARGPLLEAVASSGFAGRFLAVVGLGCEETGLPELVHERGEAYDRLLRLLGDTRREIRRAGLGTIARLGLYEQAETVMGLLLDDDPEVRAEAVRVLLRWDAARDGAFEVALEAGREDPYPEVRMAALRFVAERRETERGGPFVLGLLTDADSGVRETADEALHELVHRLPPEALLRVLDGVVLGAAYAAAPGREADPGEDDEAGRELRSLLHLVVDLEDPFGSRRDDSGGCVRDSFDQELKERPASLGLSRFRMACLALELAGGETLRNGPFDEAFWNENVGELLEEIGRDLHPAARTLIPTRGEMKKLTKDGGTSAARAAFALRLLEKDPEIGEKVAVACLFALPARRPEHGASAGSERPMGFVERLRRVGAGKGDVDRLAARVRTVSEGSSSLAPVALLALARFTGEPELRASLAHGLATGRWASCEAFLPCALRYLLEVEAREIAVKFLNDPAIPIGVRVRAELAINGFGLDDWASPDLLPYRLECVAWPRLSTALCRKEAEAAARRGVPQLLERLEGAAGGGTTVEAAPPA